MAAPHSPPPAIPDPAHDVLSRRGRGALDAIFAPRSVAVIGATEAPGSVGRTVLFNLLQSPFGGPVFPVNPRRASVLGVKAYPNLAAVPERVDLAVVVTQAATVPGVIRQCADTGVKGAIVISAGFKELGPQGAALEQQVLAEARRGRVRLVGPNCLGVMSPLSGLNATFAAGMARPGNIALLSQSGALLTAILDWSQRELVGFSALVSVGSMVDVGWGDLIDHLGGDPRTKSILIYMETIGDARAFLSAAREVALAKPILVLKAGRTEASARAAVSHTGSLTGSDEALEAAFRRTGVLRVDSIAELFHLAEVLARQPRPRGPRLTILTNAGGPAVLAADALTEGGGALAELSPETMAALDQALPPHWSRNNPVDILGDADPGRYAAALEIALRDRGSDGLLVILTPQDMTDPTQTAERLVHAAREEGKPILASWMGGPAILAGEAILNRAGIPTFPYPDEAARAFDAMWRYSDDLRALYETPALPAGGAAAAPPDRDRAGELVRAARAEGRAILSEHESKALLVAYGIPTVETHVARDAAEAERIAERIGYPVVLKLHSRTITHKTDVGGVRLDLGDAGAVREAFRDIEASVAARAGAGHFEGVTVQPMVALDGYELILGSSVDPQLGPVLLFGSGGRLVEVYRDRALALPPLDATLARRWMERTRIHEALRGVRGRAPVDLDALAALLVRFAELVAEQRWIREIDINPVLASPSGLVALDARVVLHDPALREEALPGPVIRPYPVEYAGAFRLRDGTEVTVHPIRPEDEPLVVKFHETLSERSVALRYMAAIPLDRRVAHERLIRVCFSDYDRDIALVAERREPQREILAIGRLAKIPGQAEAELALLVGDRWQRRGIGAELGRRLLDVARAEGLEKVVASMLPENREMQRLCEQLGFRLHRAVDEPLVEAEIDPREPQRAAA